jgi:hypothetical protein
MFAFFGLVLLERVLLLAGSGARWLSGAIFVTAGVYQFTSFKDVCLRHCRSPMSLILHYTGLRGPAIDLRVGVHHGIYCIGCCWGLIADPRRRWRNEHLGDGSANCGHFCRESFTPRPAYRPARGCFFLGAAVVAVIWPEFLPGLKPWCVP